MFQASPTSLQFPSDGNRHHRRLSLQTEQQVAVLDPTYSSLQQRAPQASRIVIIPKNMDPLCSFSKKVDVGNTVVCYVPRNVVFSEDPNFFDTVNDVVHVKCSQSDVNFSMALLRKPQHLPKNCLAVWTVDDRIRQHAMWSSPEYVNFKHEKPLMSVKAPWFRGRGATKGRLLHPSSRGPVLTGPVYQSSRSGSKKYQGKVPNIVALLTSHAKSHHKTQKTLMQPNVEVSMPKFFKDNHSGIEKGFWQQKRFTPVSQEIYKVLTKESKQWQEDPHTHKKPQPGEESEAGPTMQKMDVISKEKRYGFSYHLNPPITTSQLHRPSILNLPPPPQMPLPPVPEVHDPAVPGPSSRSDLFSLAGKQSVPWKELPPLPTLSKAHELFKPVAYKAQRISESVTFVNPYTQQEEHEPSLKEAKADDTTTTPHSERQRRESTCLFLPEVVKPHHVNKQKLSAVLVLSLFVVSLVMFYLVYFL